LLAVCFFARSDNFLVRGRLELQESCEQGYSNTSFL
jgi:hypothetical protein